MSLSFSWDDFWAYFRKSNQSIKAALIEELKIISLLRGTSAKYQTEVLREAPPELIQEVDSILYLQTKINLGLVVKTKYSMRVIRPI